MTEARTFEGNDPVAALALVEECPTHFPAYRVIFEHCETPAALMQAARMLTGAVATGDVGALTREEKAVLVRAASIAANEQGLALLEALEAANPSDPQYREQLHLLRFSRELRRRAREIDRTRFKRWYLFLGDTEDWLETRGEMIGVNLAHLEISGLDGWDLPVGANLLHAQFATFGSPLIFKYVVTSFDRMARDGRHAEHALLLNMISNMIRRARSHPEPALPPLDYSAPDASAIGQRSGLTKEGTAWVRPGTIELHALRNYFDDREKTLEAAEEVAEHSEQARNFADWDIVPKHARWTMRDTRRNVSRLSLNAGWYADPGSGAAAFEDWAVRYSDSLSRNVYLRTCVAEMLALKALNPKIGGAGLYIRNTREIADLIFSSSIVLVTAFADEIRAHRDAGNLERLWRHNGMESPMRGLTLIDAPMSIWPYKPHGSWSETFELLKQDCDRAIESSGADLFLASCGCYGLPIVDHVNRKHGIRALYDGQAINAYFGVVTNLPPVFPRSRQPDELYIKGGLGERFPHVARVDGGRYLS